MLTMQALRSTCVSLVHKCISKERTYMQPTANMPDRYTLRLVDMRNFHSRGIGRLSIAKSMITFKMPITKVTIP